MEDKLTKLYDRETFFTVLAKHIVTVHDHKTKLALVVVDINNFSHINKQYDYSIGDYVLKHFAQLLFNAKRSQDYVARIGDNRFALILVNIMNTGHATLAAQKIHRLLDVPFQIKDYRITVDATIGIALCPLHASKATGLLKEAEEALTIARQHDKSIGTAISVNDEELSEHWDIELDIEEAFQNRQFEIYYQPKFSLQTQKPVGAEALLRWNRRGHFVSPEIFVPIIEKTGHIKPLTGWIINSVLRHSSRWTKKWGPLSVSVNIPPDLIIKLDLKDFVHNAMNLWGDENITLVLEILERTFVDDTDKCFQILRELQSMGVQISIDDFGTGYSSLAYFKLLPIDELKIDKSFVFDLNSDEANAKLIHLMVQLGHNFNLKIVAEGIEDKTTFERLGAMGCDVGQGYYMGKAMPEKEFKEWLETFDSLEE